MIKYTVIFRENKKGQLRASIKNESHYVFKTARELEIAEVFGAGWSKSMHEFAEKLKAEGGKGFKEITTRRKTKQCSVTTTTKVS
ncbi:MAG: hypothetical protein JWR69_922 [Pedosphaera sp.]|nr:hypothetical protein [Pedosphaera sp.]